MGWWKIDSVERGQIDCSHKCPTNPGLVNAVPGHEAEDAMYNGDGPADLMGPVLRKIDAQYVSAWGRPAKPDELRAVFNFCLNGMLRQRKSRHANEDVTPPPCATKHATWGDWPHVGTCYRIRTRGGVSAFSREGFAWTDSYAQALPRPSLYIMFHNGPLNGKTLKGGRG